MLVGAAAAAVVEDASPADVAAHDGEDRGDLGCHHARPRHARRRRRRLRRVRSRAHRRRRRRPEPAHGYERAGRGKQLAYKRHSRIGIWGEGDGEICSWSGQCGNEERTRQDSEGGFTLSTFLSNSNQIWFRLKLIWMIFCFDLVWILNHLGGSYRIYILLKMLPLDSNWMLLLGSNCNYVEMIYFVSFGLWILIELEAKWPSTLNGGGRQLI